jgi:hypothetical protein
MGPVALVVAQAISTAVLTGPANVVDACPVNDRDFLGKVGADDRNVGVAQSIGRQSPISAAVPRHRPGVARLAHIAAAIGKEQ